MEQYMQHEDIQMVFYLAFDVSKTWKVVRFFSKFIVE